MGSPQRRDMTCRPAVNAHDNDSYKTRKQHCNTTGHEGIKCTSNMTTAVKTYRPHVCGHVITWLNQTYGVQRLESRLVKAPYLRLAANAKQARGGKQANNKKATMVPK